jgi:hypothetical protein
MEGDEKLRQINLWHEEWFTPIENDDGPYPEYMDYEYDGYEETKDATNPQEVDDLEHGPDELFLPALVPPEHIDNI